MSGDEKLKYKLHPMQLLSLNVRELSIVANVPPDISVGVDAQGDCSISTAQSEYDREDHTISIAMRLEVGIEESEKISPFSMKIEIVGDFSVDEENFPPESVDQFARMNAPFILLPYLREQAYSLTAKCGFRPILLSLTEVPVIERLK